MCSSFFCIHGKQHASKTTIVSCLVVTSKESLGIFWVASTHSDVSQLASLRCSSDGNDEQSSQFVKLETTKTSWQGWGTQTQKREGKKVSNPSFQEAPRLG
jgi:hypothetical protein